MSDALTPEEIGRLARRAVDRIDTYGKRGVTLVTMQEIEALALIAALSNLMPRRESGEGVPETPKFKSRRKGS